MKDNFSKQSDKYFKFRTGYPAELFTLIGKLTRSKINCWDCATGNGQLAGELSGSFENVYATDISSNQISQAFKSTNIHYSVQPAEQTNFEDDLFDLVVVGQAIHWFEFEKFYSEVRRTCKPGALLIVIGYGNPKIDPNIDPVLDHFYKNIVGPFWDTERKYIDEEYKTIPFPFEEIKHTEFSITCDWTLEHFIEYINTWSGVKHYINRNGVNPVNEVNDILKSKWHKKIKKVEFSLLLRIGKVK